MKLFLFDFSPGITSFRLASYNESFSVFLDNSCRMLMCNVDSIKLEWDFLTALIRNLCEFCYF